jgi:GR25 family glycosyltransferase involved in LPS biosynthesis
MVGTERMKILHETPKLIIPTTKEMKATPSNSLNAYFDNIYVNHLEERTDRLEILNRQFKQLNSTYTLFNAIRHKDGSVGNKLSFIKIIELAMSRGEKRILFLEDDVLFRKCILDDIGSIMKAVRETDCEILCFHNPQIVKLTEDEKKMLIVRRKHKIWCNQCLYLSNLGKIYEHVKERESNTNGLDYTLVYSRLISYCTGKEYAIQLDDYSNIKNRIMRRFDHRRIYEDLL